jgi:hypothetical protein
MFKFLALNAICCAVDVDSCSSASEGSSQVQFQLWLLDINNNHRLVFFLIGGSSRLLPLFLKVGSAMMCQTIVVLQYYRRSVSFLNYWFTDTCTRT